MTTEEREELTALLAEQMTLFDPRHARIEELIDLIGSPLQIPETENLSSEIETEV
jgi:hypothetical protein